MKTRSQAAAEQEEAAAAAATALLLKKKLQREATASKVKGSSIVLGPVAAGPIQSPWGTKTLQQPRTGKAAGRKQEAAMVMEPAGAGAAAAVTNAHRSSKALFPYPHTPGKAKVAMVAAEEQAAVQGKTRQLSDTAFAKRYQRPVFGASSPGKAAKQPLEQQQPQQPRVRQVWPKAAAAASGPVVAMGRTPVKGTTKTPSGAVSAAKGMGGGKATTGKKSSKSGRKQQEEAVLASVEAGYRDFVAALEREREAAAGEGASFQQQTRRRATRSSSSSGGGNVVMLASSTPAGKAGRRSSKSSKKTPAAVGEAGEFVVVEHTDAPPAEVAKALAAASSVVVVGDEAASFVLDATVDSSGVGAAARSEGAEAALTVLKFKAARRKKGKKGYDEVRE